jgi:hypothetical protein
MKTCIPVRNICLFLLSAVVWTGCLDVEISTEVASDGSGERIVTGRTKTAMFTPPASGLWISAR